MGNKEYKIGNPQQQLDKLEKRFTKYNIGETGFSFHEIKTYKPIFAFDYLSLNKGDLCFNSNSLNIKDFIGLLTGLKKISEVTYEDLHNNRLYRFHKIKFEHSSVKITKNDLKKVLTFKPELLDDEELPNLYQFDLHYVQKARVAGFLFKGIFYLVWYDRNHLIYS